jgi:hypothetical protein
VHATQLVGVHLDQVLARVEAAFPEKHLLFKKRFGGVRAFAKFTFTERRRFADKLLRSVADSKPDRSKTHDGHPPFVISDFAEPHRILIDADDKLDLRRHDKFLSLEEPSLHDPSPHCRHQRRPNCRGTWSREIRNTRDRGHVLQKLVNQFAIVVGNHGGQASLQTM